MKSLLKTSDSKEIIERIKKLTPHSKAEWGKMKAAQMLAHTQIPLRIASGEVKPQRSLIGILIGGFVRKKVVSEEPFKKNLPTDKKFIISDERNFDDERRELITLIEKYTERGPDGITKEPHPFFGSLSMQEWDILMSKHIDHHLRQFGV